MQKTKQLKRKGFEKKSEVFHLFLVTTLFTFVIMAKGNAEPNLPDTMSLSYIHDVFALACIPNP